MLSHATHYKTSGNGFPRYWHFDYGIDDPQAVLDMLLDRGFIRAETAKESIEKLKVPELKNILLESGVVAKGKTADLMEAVSENISEEDLARKIPIRRYHPRAPGQVRQADQLQHPCPPGPGPDGKQLKPFTSTFEVSPTWTEKSARKKAEAYASVFEQQCKAGIATDTRLKFAEYCDYVIDLKEQRGAKHSTIVLYRGLTSRISKRLGHAQGGHFLTK